MVLVLTDKGADRMRDKLTTNHWRTLLYSAATLATVLLAAGAKWKPR
jgi:hypothetical protein